MDGFKGYPAFTQYLQDRFEEVDALKGFRAVEQCSLDYISDKGDNIFFMNEYSYIYIYTFHI